MPRSIFRRRSIRALVRCFARHGRVRAEPLPAATSRYHHVLVDEFQDTSRPQWRLVELLVIQAWGEGEGVADPPAVDFRGRRSEAVHLPLPRRRGRAAPKPRRAASGPACRTAAAPAGSRTVSAPCPAARLRQRCLSIRMPQAHERSETLPYDETRIAFRSERGCRRTATRAARRWGSRPTDRIAACGGRGGRRNRAAAGAPRSGPRHWLTRPARPGDIAILFRAREGHQ